MGSLVSSPRPAATPQPEEDEGNLRAAKRRKLDQISQQESPVRRPIGRVSNSRAPRPQLEPLKSSDFYGNKQPRRSLDTFLTKVKGERKRKHAELKGTCFAKEPPDFMESLKVDVTEIVPTKEAAEQSHLHIDYPANSKLDNIPRSFDIKCRCSVAVYTAQNDEDPGNVDARDHEERCRMVKKATLRVSRIVYM